MTMTLEQLVAIEGYADEYGTVTDEMLTLLIDFANAHLARGERDGEVVAWLVTSERAGTVSAELSEFAADAAIADVVKEYSDAYGKTTKAPLYTHPAPAQAVGAVSLAEAERVAQMAYIAGKRGYTFTGYVEELRSVARPIADQPVATVGDGVTEDVVRGAHDRYLDVVREGIAMGTSSVDEDNQHKAMRAALLFARAALASPRAPRVGVPEEWEVKAAAWLREKAEQQRKMNAKYPDHAKAYPTWESFVIKFELLADELLAAAP